MILLVFLCGFLSLFLCGLISPAQGQECHHNHDVSVSVFMPRTGTYRIGKLSKSNQQSSSSDVDVVFQLESGTTKVLSVQQSRIDTTTTRSCSPPKAENDIRSLPLPIIQGAIATDHNGKFSIIRHALTIPELEKANAYFASPTFQASLTTAHSTVDVHNSNQIRTTRLTSMTCSVREDDGSPNFPEFLREKLTRLILDVDKAARWTTVLKKDTDDIFNLNRYELWYNEYAITDRGSSSTKAKWDSKNQANTIIDYDRSDQYKGWHSDEHEDWVDYEAAPPRALTMVVHLEDRSMYEGGKFWVAVNNQTKAIPFESGDAVVFPSDKLWHKVESVKSGIRRTIAIWVTFDPKYIV